MLLIYGKIQIVLLKSLKNNKRIRNVDIFLTDPIMFDTSEIYEGDTPISRIDNSTYDIA